MHKIILGAIAATIIGSSCYAFTMESAPEMGLFKKNEMCYYVFI